MEEYNFIVRLWIRFAIISILLILALSGTVYAARATLGAVHSLTVQQTLSKTGDVRAIHPWMTVPYIAHTCQVPESYLYTSLRISSAKEKRFSHATLHVIATYAKKSDNEIIISIQKAVLHYRKLHRSPKRPTLAGRIT